MASSNFDQQPQDPQHPPDLFSNLSAANPHTPQPQHPYGQPNPNPYGWAPQATLIVPPELDPPIDATALDRKTAGKVHEGVSKWIRESKYPLTPEEGKPLIRPLRDFGIALIAGTLAGKHIMSTFFPAMVAGPRSKPWLIGSMVGGYPLGAAALYFSQIPAAKILLEQKNPIGIQARFVYRSIQAEQKGLAPPPPPFSGVSTAPPSWGSMFG